MIGKPPTIFESMITYAGLAIYLFPKTVQMAILLGIPAHLLGYVEGDWFTLFWVYLFCNLWNNSNEKALKKLEEFVAQNK